MKHHFHGASVSPLTLHSAFHILHISCQHKMFFCGFVSPLPIKPASLGFAGVPISFGGEYRDRTGDLLLARQALSQLS